MAHASCPSGHGMWNGDGKPIVRAFRLDFFRDFMKEHPDCKLGANGEYWRCCYQEFSVNVFINQYVHTKNGRTLIIDEIIEHGKRYKDRGINAEGLPVIEMCLIPFMKTIIGCWMREVWMFCF